MAACRSVQLPASPRHPPKLGEAGKAQHSVEEMYSKTDSSYVHLSVGSQALLPVVLRPATLSTRLEWESCSYTVVWTTLHWTTWTSIVMTLENEGMEENSLKASIVRRFWKCLASSGELLQNWPIQSAKVSLSRDGGSWS